MSSFEIKTRQAIERVSFLLEKNHHHEYRSCDDRWRHSVETVLRILAPEAIIETPLQWAPAIRDELFRLERENGLVLKAAIAVLEARLETIIHHYSSRRSESRELTKRSRSFHHHSDRKYFKKFKHTRKRTREDTES
jgi:hypothetical protein